MISFAEIRNQFPILNREFNGHPLVYLDTAATSLKPVDVVTRIADYYTYQSANVHRGAYGLSDEATRAFEAARGKVASFINAKAEEIIFVRNTTEAINLAAMSWGEKELETGDHVLITEMEHHANIVPWQLVAEDKGVKIDHTRIHNDGSLDEEELDRKLKAPVKLLAITGCSNALGTFTNLKSIIATAHKRGIRVLVDAAQLVSQRKVDVVDLDADFLAFSGHKIFGPTGIGVLYAKSDLLKEMPPWQGGGSMISKVTFQKTTYNEAPFRFEAGTPHIEGTVGLHAALDWFTALDLVAVKAHEQSLLKQATTGLRELGATIYADLPEKGAIVSFNLKGTHPSDVAQILDQKGIAVRAGHHCCQPLMERLGVPGTVRASFSVYNNADDVTRLLAAVQTAKELLA